MIIIDVQKAAVVLGFGTIGFKTKGPGTTNIACIRMVELPSPQKPGSLLTKKNFKALEDSKEANEIALFFSTEADIDRLISVLNIVKEEYKALPVPTKEDKSAMEYIAKQVGEEIHVELKKAKKTPKAKKPRR